MKPEFSIVVPTYITNPEQILMTKNCLDLIRTNSRNYELIVVETGTLHFREDADVYIHEGRRHESRSTKALNLGFSYAKAPWIVFISNDVLVGPEYLQDMRLCFEKFEDCGAATLGTTEHSNEIEPRIREFNYWPIAMVSRKCYETIGSFDENIWGVWNDTDYLMRMYEKGFRMYQNLNNKIHHLVGQTHIKYDLDHQRIFDRNMDVFAHKHRLCKNIDKYYELLTGYASRVPTKEMAL